MRLKHFFAFALFAATSIWFCHNPVISQKSVIDYIPLSIGDTTQVIDLANDSATALITVTGETTRADGRKVFIQKEIDGTDTARNLYCFFRDGDFVSTDLDTLFASGNTLAATGNPFFEQTVARKNPSPNDTILAIVGGPDTSIFTAKLIDSVQVACGTFKDVYGQELRPEKSTVPFLTVYYANNLGLIANRLGEDTTLKVSCTYKKIGSLKIGALRPVKAYPAAKISAAGRRNSFLMLCWNVLGNQLFPKPR